MNTMKADMVSCLSSPSALIFVFCFNGLMRSPAGRLGLDNGVRVGPRKVAQLDTRRYESSQARRRGTHGRIVSDGVAVGREVTEEACPSSSAFAANNAAAYGGKGAGHDYAKQPPRRHQPPF